MVALDFGLGTSYEVAVAGNPEAKATKAMLRALRTHFAPNKVVLLRPNGEESPEIAGIAGFTEYIMRMDGRATAYVCGDYKCEMPTGDVVRMLELLGVNAEHRSNE